MKSANWSSVANPGSEIEFFIKLAKVRSDGGENTFYFDTLNNCCWQLVEKDGRNLWYSTEELK